MSEDLDTKYTAFEIIASFAAVCSQALSCCKAGIDLRDDNLDLTARIALSTKRSVHTSRVTTTGLNFIVPVGLFLEILKGV